MLKSILIDALKLCLVMMIFGIWLFMAVFLAALAIVGYQTHWILSMLGFFAIAVWIVGTERILKN